MNTRKLLDELRRMYPSPRYVWAEEVALEEHRVDAAVIDTVIPWTPTIGFEAKISRSDWLNDRDGEKSMEAREVFDSFFFVFGSDEIFLPEEVPERCGIISMEGGTGRLVRPAGVVVPSGPVDQDTARLPLRVVLNAWSGKRDAEHITRVAAREYERGRRAGMNAGRRGDRSGRRHSDHVRADLDDGQPLDLP